MTIPNLPLLDPFSPTFRGDVDAFFGGQIQATINAINPEIERINQIGAGSFTATSSTSLTVGTGTINLTIDTGKGFAPGQSVIVARTASPADFMAGQVVSYNAGTGAMVVNATASGGSGTHSGWTISVTSIVSALQLDSIIVLTSGTTWTVPDGVRKVVGYVEGGGGGGGTSTPNGGGGGGGVMFVSNVTPGTAYSYTVGAGGSAGGSGGSSSIQIGGTTFSAPGAGGSSGGGKGSNGAGVFGGHGSPAFSSISGVGGIGAFGIGRGGNGNGVGLAGGIILELYK